MMLLIYILTILTFIGIAVLVIGTALHCPGNVMKNIATSTSLVIAALVINLIVVGANARQKQHQETEQQRQLLSENTFTKDQLEFSPHQSEFAFVKVKKDQQPVGWEVLGDGYRLALRQQDGKYVLLEFMKEWKQP